MMNRFVKGLLYAPIAAALVLLIAGGAILINKQDMQARDTIRKHHLSDIETALQLARRQHGTFPPYNEFSWCGLISAPENADLAKAIETPLRDAVEKYANPEKPFPEDPKKSVAGYYYWKRSPAMFELYSVLEASPTGERNTFACPTGIHIAYDYGISSILRENAAGSTIESSPL